MKRANALMVGVERKWGATFSRFEARRDSLNPEVHEASALGERHFRNATSLTWSFGTTF